MLKVFFGQNMVKDFWRKGKKEVLNIIIQYIVTISAVESISNDTYVHIYILLLRRLIKIQEKSLFLNSYKMRVGYEMVETRSNSCVRHLLDFLIYCRTKSNAKEVLRRMQALLTVAAKDKGSYGSVGRGPSSCRFASWSVALR